VRAREAAIWSAVWVALGLGFGGIVFVHVGPEAGTQYVTAYLIEKALSVDNLFVFVLVFQYFRVAPEHQHRVLFWGVLGAIVMRGVLIVAGIALVSVFEPILYLFGATRTESTRTRTRSCAGRARCCR
jgi:tellurite resistance protein TerC